MFWNNISINKVLKLSNGGNLMLELSLVAFLLIYSYSAFIFFKQFKMDKKRKLQESKMAKERDRVKYLQELATLG